MSARALVSAAGLSPTVTLSDPAGGTALTLNGSTGAFTFHGTITDGAAGPGSLTKSGGVGQTITGTVSLTGTIRSTEGSLRFVDSTLNLGSSGTLRPDGGSLRLINSTVNGGVVAGPGTLFLSSNATLNGTRLFSGSSAAISGLSNFQNVTAGGAITVNANGTLNWTDGLLTGAGSLTVSADYATLNVSGFESAGVITVGVNSRIQNSSTPLVLGGGSRTTLNGGTIHLGGQQLQLNGGLLVNNGTVTNGTTVVNFGGLARGTGTFSDIVVNEGGRYSPGNSPGTGRTGSADWAFGGVYEFELASAVGVEGVDRDFWDINGDLLITSSATANGRFTVLVNSLAPDDSPGALAGWDPTQAYTWRIAGASGGVTGFDPSVLRLDLTGFLAHNDAAGGTFSLSSDGAGVFLNFAPVPVPEASAGLLLAIAGALAAGLSALRRRGRAG